MTTAFPARTFDALRASATPGCARVVLQRVSTQIGSLGATVRGDLVDFYVWAPRCTEVTLRLEGREAHQRDFRMMQPADGYWGLTLPAAAGDRYRYLIGETAVPDPVSRLLPEGVHGPTEIVDPAFEWSDESWRGVPLPELILYELHVGTFTPEGTLDAIVARLDYLRDLGVTAIELMPLNAVPGERNWGYDGVGLYAVQSNYGGPAALRRLVDAAHRRGLAVILDVVYNHLGNEGNYLSLFGPYFTARHKTLWGDAINYDDKGSANVRRFVVENAVYWLREYHLDGLRLDAVQTIKDDSSLHIVAEIAARAHAFGIASGRNVVVIAETDENLPRYVLPAQQGGYAADAVWSDDLHHALHVLLTGESAGYYGDFQNPGLVPRALSEAYVYQGEPFRFWQGKPRGAPPVGVPLESQVVCIQNHDQVGNRAFGGRLTALSKAGARKMASALLLLAPHTPLLFMGQEYDESAPFQFFSSFTDPVIQKAVSEGRLREFAEFGWTDVPDPQSPATFEHSRLQWLQAAENLDMLAWYKELLHFRRQHVTHGERTARAEWLSPSVLSMQIPAGIPHVLIAAALPGGGLPEPEAGWELRLESDQDGYRVRVFVRAG